MSDLPHAVWLNPNLIDRWRRLAQEAGDQDLSTALARVEPVPGSFALLKAMRAVEMLAKRGDPRQRHLSLVILSEMDHCIGRL